MPGFSSFSAACEQKLHRSVKRQISSANDVPDEIFYDAGIALVGDYGLADQKFNASADCGSGLKAVWLYSTVFGSSKTPDYNVYVTGYRQSLEKPFSKVRASAPQKTNVRSKFAAHARFLCCLGRYIAH